MSDDGVYTGRDDELREQALEAEAAGVHYAAAHAILEHVEAFPLTLDEGAGAALVIAAQSLDVQRATAYALLAVVEALENVADRTAG